MKPNSSMLNALSFLSSFNFRIQNSNSKRTGDCHIWLTTKGKTLLTNLVILGFLFVSSLGLAQDVQTLNPVDDAYLQRSSFTSTSESRYNDETLRVENSSNRVRDSYLKFDLSGINGTITDLELELTVYTDPGSGTIDVYKGSGNNWTENTLSNSNKPSTPGSPLGSFTGTHSENAKKILTLNPSILDGNILSIVIKHTTNSDVAFGSTGPETSSIFDQAPQSKWPKLKVTYTPPSAPDTQAPDPGVLQVVGQPGSDTSLGLSIVGFTDNIDVTQFEIYMNNELRETIDVPSFSISHIVTDLLPGTSYSFYAIALDAAGNRSLPTATEEGSTTGTPIVGGNDGYWIKPAGSSNIHYTDGNVGIGITALTTYKLTVDGNIRSREVRVDNDNWSDYVFLKDYKLPTLQEVEQHILEKGHLMNIPSAAEVEANGIALGEMNQLLLEKIEELTLYIIDQEKRINELERKE